jgi:hypothetical protein
MKPTAVLALGVLAFAVGAALAPTALPGPARAAESGASAGSFFQATVTGADSGRATGRVAFGALGLPGEPGSSFTITLGADNARGAIVLTRRDGAAPVAGRYPIGEATALAAAGGFQAIYIAGAATDPRGVFRAESGTLHITSQAGDRMTGHFEMHAVGFLADEPDDETRRVTLSGAFTASGNHQGTP